MKALLIAQIVTTADVIIAAAFSLIAVIHPESILPPNSIVNDVSQTFALYYAARTIPIAVVALVAILKKESSVLIAFGILAAVVQFFDAGIGLFRHDLFKTVAPTVLGTVQLIGIYPLFKVSQVKSISY